MGGDGKGEKGARLSWHQSKTLPATELCHLLDMVPIAPHGKIYICIYLYGCMYVAQIGQGRRLPGVNSSTCIA